MEMNLRLEQATWDLFWVPDSVSIIDSPELLALAEPSGAPHMNAAYRVRAAPLQVPDVIERLSEFHSNGVSRVHVPDTTDVAALERALDERCYRPIGVHDARVASVGDFKARTNSAVRVRRVSDERGLRDCWSVMDQAFSRALPRTEHDLRTELGACASPSARTQRFVVYLDGEPVSSGGINLHDNLSFGFLWAGGTVPRARHRGAYSALVAERVRWASARGISAIGLYAQRETSSPIVAAQGLKTVGQMTYWERAERGRAPAPA